MLKVSFLWFMLRQHLHLYIPGDLGKGFGGHLLCLKERVSEMKIPSPSSCVFFLKCGDSRQETALSQKIFTSSVEGFK